MLLENKNMWKISLIFKQTSNFNNFFIPYRFYLKKNPQKNVSENKVLKAKGVKLRPTAYNPTCPVWLTHLTNIYYFIYNFIHKCCASRLNHGTKLKELRASSEFREKISIGALVQSRTKLLLNFLGEPWGWSRYITMTVMSSWKWRLTPFSSLFMSLYLISFFLAASWTAALTKRFAIPCRKKLKTAINMFLFNIM